MKRSDLQQNARQYINGRWETGVTTGISENPSDTREVVAEYARADRSQTELAIRAAADAFPHWSQTTPQRRADVLDQIGSEILARKEELGLLLAREEGKTLPEAVGEAARAGQIFKFFAGEALRGGGETLASVRPGVQVDVTREPVGVVGLITPWNFPLAIPAWKIAPALAYGNSVVFKPAELVPACGWALAEIISRAALPAGTFNLVMGSGREVGQTLVDSPLVDAISFTGSVATGERILQARRRAARQGAAGDGRQEPAGGAGRCRPRPRRRLRGAGRLLLDRPALHGVEPADRRGAGARRLRGAAAPAAGGAQGRPCAGARHRHRPGGRPARSSSRTSPAVGRSRSEEGAEHVWRRRARCSARRAGHYMSPALFLARPEHRVAREEIFGPVACVLRADDYEHALALANDTPFGLCAGICTTSLKHAMHFKRHAKVGMTMVNLPTAGVDYHVPFGGRKASSYGPREQGRHAAEFYTTVKTGYVLA